MGNRTKQATSLGAVPNEGLGSFGIWIGLTFSEGSRRQRKNQAKKDVARAVAETYRAHLVRKRSTRVHGKARLVVGLRVADYEYRDLESWMVAALRDEGFETSTIVSEYVSLPRGGHIGTGIPHNSLFSSSGSYCEAEFELWWYELPDPGGRIRAGNELRKKGDTSGARKAYQHAIDSGHASHAPRAAYNLGLLLAAQDDVEGARAAYQMAINSGQVDDMPRASLELGKLLAKHGDVEGARKAFQRAIDSRHTDAAPRGALNLGVLLHNDVKDLVGARKSYEYVVTSEHAVCAPIAAKNIELLNNAKTE